MTEANYLKSFEDGEDIIAAEINSNNQFLLNKISSNGTATQAYVAGEVAKLTSNLANTKNALEEKLAALEESVEKVDAKSEVPDYAKATGITFKSGQAVGFDGWISIYSYTLPNDQNRKVYINGTIVHSAQGGSDNGYGDSTTNVVRVQADDIITISGNASTTYKKIPIRGVS